MTLTRLSDEASANLRRGGELLARISEEGDRAAFSPPEIREIKRLLDAILGGIADTDEAGNFRNKMDRAIEVELYENRGVVASRIESVPAQDPVSSLDYYEIYYEVLANSGLVGKAMPEPAILRELMEETGGFSEEARFGEFELIAQSRCNACSVCGICGACGACSWCKLSFIKGTVGSGGLGGAVGAAGTFLVQE
jgi:hypothetical protein